MVLAIRRENGLSSSSFFQELAESLPDSRVRDRLVLFGDLAPETPLVEVVRRFGSSGYVVETVPLALFLARRMTGEAFAAGLDELVEAGGDTDTIGSIAGQVAGAHLGFSRLPRDLIGLAPVQEILELAGAFAGSFPD